MTTEIQNILFTFLGALIAILAGPVSEKIRERRKRSAIASAIRTDLEALMGLAAMMAYSVRSKHGRLDRKTWEWTLAKLDASNRPQYREFTDLARAHLARAEATDDVIKAASATMVDQTKSVGMRTLSLPYTSTQLSQLELFAPKQQQALLEILSDVGRYNEVCDELVRYFQQTYTTEGANREAVQSNIRLAENTNASLAGRIADAAERLKGDL
jgi:hypothetical protein